MKNTELYLSLEILGVFFIKKIRREIESLKISELWPSISLFKN